LASAKAKRSPLRPGAVKSIGGLLKRATVVTNEVGEHGRIVLPLEELWPGGEELVARRHAHLSAQQFDLSREVAPAVRELRELIGAFPRELLLMDLETCGLSGSPLFLVGLLRHVEDRLAVELLLARTYAEEHAVLASFWQRVAAHRVLVTFNGKSFDWPMVVDRSARYLIFRQAQLTESRPPELQPPELLHVDLLHHSRRRWRRQLPDCRLQTLERHICGRGRSGDIAGAQIPAAYQEFVRTGFDRDMDAILLHNAIDLVTLLDLAMRLAA
ncbi:MAG: ribonuclease H-like domain-containing protein, partial [Thermoguttaceae bacterium]